MKLALLFAILTTSLLAQSPRPAAAPVRSYKLSNYSETALPNGLTVVFVQDDRLPLVTARLVLPGGSKKESSDQQGIASAFATLLLKGTSGRSGRQLLEDLDGVGAALTAVARPDSVTLEGNVVSENTGSLLVLMSEILRSVELPEREIDAYKRGRLQSLRNDAGQPASIASRLFTRALFGRTGYGLGDPDPEALAEIDRQMVENYRAIAVVPSQITLILIGKLPPRAELTQMVTYLFNSRETKASEGKATQKEAPRPIPETKQRFLFVDRPGAPQTEIRFGHIIPGFANPDILSLQVASAILAGRPDSRLSLQLHDTLQPGEDVHTEVNALADGGAFAASARVRNEIAGDIIGKLLAQLNRMANEPVDAAELADAKSNVAGSFLLRIASQRNLADMIAMMKIAKAPKDYLDSYVSQVNALDAARLQSAAKKWIAPDSAVVIVVGDASKIGDQLKKIPGIASFETVDANGAPVQPKSVPVPSKP